MAVTTKTVNVVSELEITATQFHRTATQVINGNKVTYTYNHSETSASNDVSFTATDTTRALKVQLSGNYSLDNFYVTFTNFKNNDFEICSEVLKTCKTLT